jgi:hypothetical protein
MSQTFGKIRPRTADLADVPSGFSTLGVRRLPVPD